MIGRKELAEAVSFQDEVTDSGLSVPAYVAEAGFDGAGLDHVAYQRAGRLLAHLMDTSFEQAVRTADSSLLAAFISCWQDGCLAGARAVRETELAPA
jgi:hypothetical protein